MLNFDKLENITSVPKYDVVISSENGEKDIIQLVKCIYPKWDENSISIEKMKGGVINNMFKCSENDGNDIVIRIYLKSGDEKMDEVFDRTREIKNFEKLKHLGLIPELLAVFKNGLCYEYVKGDVLTCTTVRSEKMIPYVTKLLAKLNSLPAVDWSTPFAIDDMDKSQINFPPRLNNPERMKRFFKFLPNEEAFKNEFEYLKKYFLTIKSPKVFCHNDTKGENFIWNETKGELRLIDLEHSGMNYQAFEIGGHFVSYTDINDPKFGCYPTRDFQLKWIRSYLEFYYEASGRSPSDVTDRDIEELYVECNKLAQVVRFFVSTACLSLVEYGIFDSYEFCMIHLQEYFENKDKVDALVLSNDQ